jgi:hypothetical protein
MAAVHVFAIDWIPSKDDKASGGGLRSLQIVEALRDAGHRVTFSVPVNCRHVRSQGRDSAELRAVLIHDQNNQIDIPRETRPDAVFWLPTLIRDIPFTGLGDMVQVCDLIGLPHIEAAMGSPVQASKIRDKLVGLCDGADLVLTGSEEQASGAPATRSRATRSHGSCSNQLTGTAVLSDSMSPVIRPDYRVSPGPARPFTGPDALQPAGVRALSVESRRVGS